MAPGGRCAAVALRRYPLRPRRTVASAGCVLACIARRWLAPTLGPERAWMPWRGAPTVLVGLRQSEKRRAGARGETLRRHVQLPGHGHLLRRPRHGPRESLPPLGRRGGDGRPPLVPGQRAREARSRDELCALRPHRRGPAPRLPVHDAGGLDAAHVPRATVMCSLGRSFVTLSRQPHRGHRSPVPEIGRRSWAFVFCRPSSSLGETVDAVSGNLATFQDLRIVKTSGVLAHSDIHGREDPGAPQRSRLPTTLTSVR